MGAFRLCAFFLLCGAACFLSGSRRIGAQSAAETQPDQHYLWSRLTSRVDISTLQAGDPVTAHVVDTWTLKRCYLREGTVLQGKVLRIRPTESGKGVALTLAFTGTCIEGTEAPVTLIAVLYPKDDESHDQMQTYMAMPSGLGAGTSGRRSTDLSRLPSSGSELPQRPRVKVGQVSGIRHLKLSFAADAPAQSILLAENKALRLEKGTRLVFRLADEAR
jgi:hypothetical protein